jgi:Coenzyme PQQ synthesis protein D (PqqD)
MRTETTRLLPCAREEELVKQELQGETLVYDLKRHKAHCLNQTAALVWKHCDGQPSVAEIVARMEKELHASVNEDVIRLALDHLENAHLLMEKTDRKRERSGLSRREVIRKLGPVAALSLPVVASILAPEAAQAATCIDPAQCNPGNNGRCCNGGGVCNGATGMCT